MIHISSSCWVQYCLSSPYFSSLPWVSKGAVPQHLWLIQICPDVIPISVTGFLLLFPHHEATPSVAICSGILTNCRQFALFVGLFFSLFGFPSSDTEGQRSWAGRAGMHGGGWAGPQQYSQSCCCCCWDSLTPPGASGLLRVSETVPAFNTWSQLCFQNCQLGHRHCSDTHRTAVSNH